MEQSMQIVDVDGADVMSENAKFWYTLLIPTLVSIFVVFVAWVASYGALSQEVKGLKEDVNSLQGSLTPLTENVRQLGLVVAANTTELRVRFGGTNAKLFFYERTGSAEGLRHAWGDFSPTNEPEYCGYAELVACMGGYPNVRELASVGQDREWFTYTRLQELFSNKSTF